MNIAKGILSGKSIPKVGLGCMGMSEFYGNSDDNNSINTLLRAFEIGYRHFDTASMYGFGHNETLLGRFIEQLGNRRDEIVIASKVGIRRNKDNPYKLIIDNDRKYIKTTCENSLRSLKTDYIDLFYLHRIDPNANLDETVDALKELLKEGKIKSVGLCEVSVETLNKFHSLLPVEAVQSEYSLWTRDIEESVVPACLKMGISIIAFSPLGRGFLTGKIDKRFMKEIDKEKDFRARLPRFNENNIDVNLELVGQLAKIAANLNITTSELALSWVINKYDNIFVIPGTRNEKYLQLNYKAGSVKLDEHIVAALDELFVHGAVQGTRYPADILAHSNA